MPEPEPVTDSTARSRRLVLAPGLRVLVRDRQHWQLGTDLGAHALVRREPALDQALRVVATGAEPPDEPAVRESLAVLAEHGLVVELDALDRVGRSPDAAALARHAPFDFTDRWARRRAATVEVVGDLGVDPAPLLAASGVGMSPDEPTATLVLATSEVDRESLSALVRAGRPHLVCRLVDGVAILGPLVVPGVTACLRCVDLHGADDVPGSDLRTQAYAEACALPRADGVPEPRDTALATLATAWAVRDLVTHLDGERASTWSTTHRLAANLSSIVSVSWRRHPECGCLWT